MAWAFLALAIGAAVGAAGILPSGALPWVARLTNAALALLLFTMGAGIGADPDILAGLGLMGVQAAAMALATSAGSVLAVWMICRAGLLGTAACGSASAVSGAEGSSPWALTGGILASVALGIIAGWLGILPTDYLAALAPVSAAALAVILLGIGIEIGHNRTAWAAIVRLGWRALLVPAGIVAGTLVGALAAGWLTGLPANEAAAVGAGFGWYSLSGVLLTQIYNAPTGALAFLSNVLRELIAVVAMPLLARQLPPAAALAPGGATTMDTTLPIVARSMGSEAALLAFASGATLTILVPILVPILIRL